MGISTSAAYLGNADNSVNTDRKIIEVLCGAKEGVSASDGMQVAPVSGQHQVAVSPGRVFMAGRDVDGSQGFYFAWSDGDDTLDLPVPAGANFIATVIVRVADTQYGTVPDIEGAYYEVLSGTPNSTPTPLSDVEIDATAVPGSWYRLADVRINTDDTGEIPSGQVTDTRTVLGTIATLAARVLATETGVSDNADAISDLAGLVAALDIPDIRVQQSQPSSDLVAGKTVWIDWES